VRPAEDGGVALLTVTTATAVFAVAVIALTVATDLALAAGRAQAGADAAALAVAATAATSDAGDAASLAGDVAAANAVALRSCCEDPRAPWPWAVRVSTQTSPRTALGRAVLPLVRARAAAVPEPPPGS
jgi:hypothetical protein